MNITRIPIGVTAMLAIQPKMAAVGSEYDFSTTNLRITIAATASPSPNVPKNMNDQYTTDHQSKTPRASPLSL